MSATSSSGANTRLSWVHRTLPVFSVAGVLGYFMCMVFNWAPFAYYPVVGEFHVARLPGIGPPMFWYGWLIYASLIATFASLLALLLSVRLSFAPFRRHSWILWAIPAGIELAIVILMRPTLFP